MISKEDWSKFHKHLVQEVANFLKDKDIGENPWMFSLSIDDIPSLVKYGKWTPYNDSYMGILDTDNNEIIWEM